MKYLTILLLSVLLITACDVSVEEGETPADLEGKKALLKEKKQELSTLTEEITDLEQEIAELDPNIRIDTRTLVTTQTLKRSDFEHFVEIQGSVQADDYVDAVSETAGRIIRLTVDEGDRVRSGQLIAELDLEQLDKQRAELEKSLELAKTVYERQKSLWDQNIGSEIQFLEAKNNKERLEKSLETLAFQASKSKVYAPAAGVVERVILQSGELASPGMPIVQILNTAKLKVVADVPETYLRAVAPGKTVKVEFPALDMEQQARVNLVGSTIDPANRTFEVEASIRRESGLIKPNLLAVMYIQDYKEEQVVTVPLTAIQQEVGGKDFVFVKATGEEGATTAKKVYVKTGKSYQGDIVVEEGLDGTEELIMDGARGLADGQPIKVTETQG